MYTGRCSFLKAAISFNYWNGENVHALSKFIEENSIKGFLAEDEGLALNRYAREAASIGPCLEIGSYCGLSTVYIGDACKHMHNTLYALDHHRGSEEHQLGEEYHDTQLYDESLGAMDSFPAFRRTLKLANLEETVVPIVASSQVASKHWATPLGFVFVDGGHSHESSMFDCVTWSEFIAPGGFLAVHDLFEFPEEGGQGPFLAFQQLLNSGQFEQVDQIQSLGILKKKI